MNYYTAKQIAWLRDNFSKHRTNVELAEAFNEHFGTDYSYMSILGAINHHVDERRRYSSEQIIWAYENPNDNGVELAREFEEKFGIKRSPRNIIELKYRIRESMKRPSYEQSMLYRAYNERVTADVTTAIKELMKGYCRICVNNGKRDGCTGCILAGGELKFKLDPKGLSPKDMDGFEL